MANEISASVVLSATKGHLSVARRVSSRFTLAGTHYASQVQGIPHAAPEALAFPADVATKGWAFFRNTDTTNPVSIGPLDALAALIPVVTLQPGEFALIPLGTATLYAQATTATVALEWILLER